MGLAGTSKLAAAAPGSDDLHRTARSRRPAPRLRLPASKDRSRVQTAPQVACAGSSLRLSQSAQQVYPIEPGYQRRANAAEAGACCSRAARAATATSEKGLRSRDCLKNWAASECRLSADSITPA